MHILPIPKVRPYRITFIVEAEDLSEAIDEAECIEGHVLLPVLQSSVVRGKFDAGGRFEEDKTPEDEDAYREEE